MRIRLTTKNIEEFCKYCLEYRLYKPGIILDGMKEVYQAQSALAIAIAFDEDTPIGAATISNGEYNIQIWIKPKYRRKGIGTALLKKLRPHLPSDIRYMKNYSNKQFWESVNEITGR